LAGCFAELRANRPVADAIVRFVVCGHVLVLLLLAFSYFPHDAAGWLELAGLSSAGVFFLLLVLMLFAIRLLRSTDGTRVARLGLANKLTLFRFVLVVPVAVLIIQDRLIVALLLYVTGGLTDILDGIAARRGTQTRFGVMMDPTADILATTGAFGALYASDLVPWWVFAILVARYLGLGFGSLVLTCAVGPITFTATRTGKIVGVLQAAAVILIVALTAAGLEWRDRWGAYIYPFLAVIFGVVIVSKMVIAARHIRGRTAHVGTQG
jgi:phosphatidylglycerophosphate synthase